MTPDEKAIAPKDLFAGNSEMAMLMRSLGWSQTPLGPITDWPQSLRTAVSICLESRFPCVTVYLTQKRDRMPSRSCFISYF